MALERIKTLAHIALALAGAFAFAAVGFVALETRPVVRHLDGVLTRAEAVESKINATAANLDDATRQWAAASKTEAASVAAATQQAQQVLSAAQGAIAETRTAVATANTQLAQLDPLLTSARVAGASAEEQERWAKESGKQTKQRRHGEGSDTDVLVGPFAFESYEQPEAERNGSFHSNFDCRKRLIRAVKGF